MKMYPSTAETKLGFDIVRAKLRELMLSPLGEDRLSRMETASSLERMREELERVSELQGAIQRGDALPMEDFLDVRETLSRASPEGAFVAPQDLLAVRLVCRLMRRLRKFFKDGKYPRMAARTAILVVFPDLERYLDGIVDANGDVRDDASQELRRIRRKLIQKKAALRARLRDVLQRAQSRGFATEAQPTMRSGRMVIPLRAEAKRKIKGFVHGMSATGQTVYLEPAACLELNNEVRLLEGEESREIERILQEATARIRENLPVLETNLACLAHFDLMQAKARLGNRLGAVAPQLTHEQRIDIREGRSPSLVLHLAGQEDGADRGAIVPLDLTLGEKARTLVITGPNAGGKTVAMKTVGLLSLMLAYGLPIPVHPASSFCLFDRLLVEIGDEQSIEKDLSTFSSRVAGLRRMLKFASDTSLILIDEIGTGTDPAEGAALAQATLERFTLAGARCVVTTHHGTLKAYAHTTEGVENGSMEFDPNTLRPTFKFRQGLPGSSFAFRIAERMEFDGAVLGRARALLGAPQTALEELIATFEVQNKALANQLKKVDGYVPRRRKLRRSRPVRTRSAKPSIKKPFSAKAKNRSMGKQSSGATGGRPANKQVHVKEGDRVVFDDGSTVGEVIQLKGSSAVVTFGSMRMHVNAARLKRVGGVQLASPRPRISGNVHIRIDLHGYSVRDAVKEVERFIDRAVAANSEWVEIQHGRGTGALREAIHAYLASASAVAEFATAPTNPGATDVRLA